MPASANRKPRARLSCTFCREKKLRCNRHHPCNNCTKRNQAVFCQYISDPPRAQPSNTGNAFPYPPEGVTTTRPLANAGLIRLANERNSVEKTSDGTQPSDPPSESPLPGKIIPSQDGPRYINSAHWQAILDDIDTIKKVTQNPDDGPPDETPHGAQSHEFEGPVLLVGASLLTTKAELLRALPPRAETDRFVAHFFGSKESPLIIFHPPTFQEEYVQFWANPNSVSPSWLALLYGMLCASSWLCHRSGYTFTNPNMSTSFRTRAAQCLIMANYTTPGRYKVEALIMYLGVEYLKTSDAQVSVSVLLSILTRLAMHMGYHRDSRHYPHISVFEGEMRRRVWLYLTLLDFILSSQAGVPRTISKYQSDTALPRNLLDEDFGPTATTLPPARPESESTPITRGLVKARFLDVATDITDTVYSREELTYERILHLDQRLQDAYDKFPTFLKSCPPSDMPTNAPPDIILYRYEMELVYETQRCVLHRRYLTQNRQSARFAYCRWACVDAAQHILHFQRDLHRRSMSGQIGFGTVFFSSATSGMYLMAAMVICLELSFLATTLPVHDEDDSTTTAIPRSTLIQTLQTSYDIWVASREQSAEARKAADITGAMLGLTKARQDNKLDIIHSQTIMPNEPFEGQPSTVNPMSAPYALALGDDPAVGLLQEMLNDPSELDWGLWDNSILRPGLDPPMMGVPPGNLGLYDFGPFGDSF